MHIASYLSTLMSYVQTMRLLLGGKEGNSATFMHSQVFTETISAELGHEYLAVF